MAGSTVNIGTGATIVFGTSGFTSEVMSIDWSGITRAAVETTHLGTSPAGAGKIASKTHIPGDLADAGEISLELHFDPDQNPPVEAVTETVTLTLPLVAGDATAATDQIFV